MKKYLSRIFISASVLLIGCSTYSKIPQRPSEIIITWYKSGGLMPGYENIYISKDSCIHEIRYNGLLKQRLFTLTKDQLSSLYDEIYINNYATIQSDSTPVLDRGGSEISLIIDDINYGISNLGHNVIKKEFISNYLNIENAIKNVSFDELERQKNDFSILLDESISQSNHNVILYINDKEVYNEQKDGQFEPFSIKLFKNSNKFKVLMMNKGNNPYQTVVAKHELIIGELSDNNKIILTLVNNSLNVK